MMYYRQRNFTGSVLRSNDRTPFYGANKRSPQAAPYLNQAADHDVAADRPSLASQQGVVDAPRSDPRAMRDGRGQTFYKSKNGPGDRGADHVSYPGDMDR